MEKDYGLVIRLQQNDIEAFNAIYWQYHQNLYSNIYKIIKDHEAVQDILQEVFITLWEKRLAIDPKLPVANWLFVVSYNKSIDYLKRDIKRAIFYGDINEIIDNIGTDEINLKEKQLVLLEKALQRLSAKKRRVFELCKIQRKTYEEAANEIGISKHTVKEYLSSAITFIKQYFKSKGGADLE
jgi:RNA polymerase sigma factor (sigma-70 family)